MNPIPAEKAKFMRQGARCDLCPNVALPHVPPLPNPQQPLDGILVGEAPGRSEEKLGRPFVGLSGQMVDGLLQETKLSRNRIHLTNAALCRNDDDKANEIAAECCAPRLLQELSHLPPTIPILACGKTAAASLLGVSKIITVRGFIWTMPSDWESPKARKKALKLQPFTGPRHVQDLKVTTLVGREALVGRVVLPTVHPSFVLRSQPWTPIIRRDFQRFARLVKKQIDPTHLADQGTHQVTQKVQDLYKLSGKICLDIETTETGSPLTCELLCVGVSDGRNTKVLWPWKARFAKPLANFLRGRLEVVGHNLMTFDKVVLERYNVK